MRLFRPPVIARLIYPEALFRMNTRENELCLTFDDGPDPESTPEVLEILRSRRLNSVFFCCGHNAEKYPDLTWEILKENHLIGNHGFKHLNGWRTGIKEYIEDIKRASRLTSGSLFRPPYGSLHPDQYKELRKSFNIVFWDLMAYDWDPEFGKEGSLRILKEKIRPGSVIVLHDKSTSALKSFLGEFLDYATESGYRFVVPEFITQGTMMPRK